MHRLFLAFASTFVAATLAYFLWPDSAPVDFQDNSEEIARILADRAATGPGSVEQRIPRSVAETMFLNDPSRFEWDPEAYYRYLPHLANERRWPEHPNKAWSRVTNERGLRDAPQASLASVDLGVLVTGDSHTDGACGNDETLGALLEEKLRAADPERSVEVLNTGVVGYTFTNYLGVLRRFLDEGPDVFVVVVYGGNDFVEVLRPYHYLTGTAYPPRRSGYWGRIEAAKAVSQTFVAQSLNQALFLQEHPEELDVALEGALVTMNQIADECRAHDVRLVVAYLPPAYEAPWPELDEMIEDAMDALEISEADLFVTRRLEQQFFEGLDRLGVDWVDLTPALQAEDEACYWSRDLHINLAGHRVAAEVLFDRLASGGGELGPIVKSSKPDGVHEEKDASGQLVARGEIRSGLRVGEWVHYYPSGKVRCRGHWTSGHRNGEWTWFYESGQTSKSGTFTAGERAGEWTEWYQDGIVRQVGGFAAGKPAGRWQEWHSSGSPASDGHYKGGERDGPWTTFYEGGDVHTEVSYRAGKMDGPIRSLSPDGLELFTGSYRAGTQVGEWNYFHPGGARKARGEFIDGRREGAWSFWDEDSVLDEARSGTYRQGQLQD